MLIWVISNFSVKDNIDLLYCHLPLWIVHLLSGFVSFMLMMHIFHLFASGIRKVIREVVKKPSTERQSGVAALFYYVMRGSSLGFHSKAEQVLGMLMSNSIFSISDKLNQGKLFSQTRPDLIHIFTYDKYWWLGSSL